MAAPTRRLLEQLKHCVIEAESVFMNSEDVSHAVDDLDQAQLLLDAILKRLKPSGDDSDDE